jgi:predicted alpha-1,2-mannosidase
MENDVIYSFLDEYKKINHLPIWALWGHETGCMPGISSVQIMCESILKGVPGLDVDEMWKAMVTVMNSTDRGLAYHRELKLIPTEVYQPSVGGAQELCISDGHLALVADKLGKKDESMYYRKRARNYQLYWDPGTKFYRGKHQNGQWLEPFNPVLTVGSCARAYTCGSAWMYLFTMPHDVAGMVKTMGGEGEFIRRFDEQFTVPVPEPIEMDLASFIGQYAMGNEDAHHLLYLYAYVGQQWKSSQWLRYAMDVFYQNNEAGVPGNEDCGAMSTWYIWSAIGFYPVFPGSCEYVFGAPCLDTAEIVLDGGKKFTVKAPGTSSVNRYIQSVTLNGERYTKSYIRHADIVAGGEIVFTMGREPNKLFGAKSEDRPHSSMDL